MDRQPNKEKKIKFSTIMSRPTINFNYLIFGRKRTCFYLLSIVRRQYVNIMSFEKVCTKIVEYTLVTKLQLLPMSRCTTRKQGRQDVQTRTKNLLWIERESSIVISGCDRVGDLSIDAGICVRGFQRHDGQIERMACCCWKKFERLLKNLNKYLHFYKRPANLDFDFKLL